MDDNKRIDALAKRLEKLEHRVLELEWEKQKLALSPEDVATRTFQRLGVE